MGKEVGKNDPDKSEGGLGPGRQPGIAGWVGHDGAGHGQRAGSSEDDERRAFADAGPPGRHYPGRARRR